MDLLIVAGNNAEHCIEIRYAEVMINYTDDIIC
jgi:hypothetical protein